MRLNKCIYTSLGLRIWGLRMFTGTINTFTDYANSLAVNYYFPSGLPNVITETSIKTLVIPP